MLKGQISHNPETLFDAVFGLCFPARAAESEKKVGEIKANLTVLATRAKNR